MRSASGPGGTRGRLIALCERLFSSLLIALSIIAVAARRRQDCGRPERDGKFVATRRSGLGLAQGGSTPAGALPALTKEHEMTPDTTSATLTRAERLLLAAAAVRGVLAGAARAIVTWLLEHYIN